MSQRTAITSSFIFPIFCVGVIWALLGSSPRAEQAPQGAARPGEISRWSQPGPARDVRPTAETGSAIIRGCITDAEDGHPLRRVAIRLSRRNAQGEPRGTVTDDQGVYEVRDLPVGEYVLSVRKPGYADTTYGQRRPAEFPKPIRLREGEVLERADVALARGGVVTGRVVDEVGEPVLGATVQVLRRTWVRGRRQMVPAGSGTTNDLGAYRVFGLPAGQYYVQAQGRPFSPAESSADAPTYYPGSNDASSASTVPVFAGQEAMVDVSLLATKVQRLSGVVLSGSGRPLASGRVTASRRGEAEESFGAPRGATVRPDGTFTLEGLTSGTWRLTAWGQDGATRESDREFAQVTVGVGSGDAEGVTLVLSRGGTLRGRVQFQGRPPFDVTRFRVATSPADPSDGSGLGLGSGSVSVGADGTFEMTGLAGRRMISASGMTQGWAVKAILVGGQDVQDSGVDVQAGRVVAGVEVILAQDSATLSGQVVTARGEAVRDYSVLVFADDAERWFLPSGRWLKTARADQDGAFKVTNLSAGRFLVLAAESIDSSVLGDPEELARLRPYASSVTLTEREQRALQLTLVVF